MLPVFVTIYIPFFLAANYVPDWEPKKRPRFLAGVWSLVAIAAGTWDCPQLYCSTYQNKY